MKFHENYPPQNEELVAPLASKITIFCSLANEAAIHFISHSRQWCNHSKIFLGGTKCFVLGEQQYFVWDIACQSTK